MAIKSHEPDVSQMETTREVEEDLENSSTESMKVTNTQTIGAPKDDSEQDEEEEPLCPLFMETLPKDFLRNPQLAAIASLLEDDEDDDKKDKNSKRRTTTIAHDESPIIAPRPGGGKIGRSSRRNNRATTIGPYPKLDKNKTEKRKASLGEAQLFLNMWKI